MSTIKNEIFQLNKIISEEFTNCALPISEDLVNFINSKSKRIRASLIFLMAKSLNYNISYEIFNLACCVELIHNATLIHDDIIDNAELRRGKISLNKKLGNNLSVLTGDLILSAAMKKLSLFSNNNLLKIFSSAMNNMVKGEINQYFSKNRLPSFDEYINKTNAKTAELFNAGLLSLCEIVNIKEKKEIQDFAYNFGIAFQLKDDLTNIEKNDTSKPQLNDILNGIYTLPVIYLDQIIPLPNNNIDILKEIKDHPQIIQKTRKTIKDYIDKAINSLYFIPDNSYKEEIINISKSLYLS